MKRIKVLMMAGLLMLLGTEAFSQDTLRLSLQDAKEYGQKNNKSLLNAQRDLLIAKYTVWETASNYAPRIDGSASITDNLKIATNLLPAQMFGGPEGEYIEVKFGQTFNSSYGVSVSQAIFNGALIVGIQTARLYKDMAQTSYEKSETSIMDNIVNSYFIIKVSERYLKVLESNLENITALYNTVKVTADAGLSEKTDADQLFVQMSAVKNAYLSTQRSLEMATSSLKFLLGIDSEAVLDLSDGMPELLALYQPEAMMGKEFVIDNNIDFQLSSMQVKLTEKQLLSKKAEVLPSLAAFFSYSQSGMGDELFDQSWYPSSYLGLKLTVPIFAGTQRYHSIQSAKVSFEKSKTQHEMVSEQLMIQEKQMRSNLNNALENYMNQKENVLVAKSILDNMLFRYEQGLNSSMELVQTNNNYLGAENNLIQAELTLIQAVQSLNVLLNNQTK